jgi:hypothetical protein
MDDPTLVSKLLRDDVLIPLLVFSGVIVIVLIKTVASVIKTCARERSRREIAAFISEGTMSPEQGERLMRAEPKE